ncbi:uncharacterized protein LOC121727298 [Aricia agestis]|uniref:uncharacterized protein LOC121727298 n=1 Tax=Aricia agestis TaxID=91739 RepID=UPI001C209CA2|nr:uncharacterized protein LOC121727298 [Aricia agestis]
MLYRSILILAILLPIVLGECCYKTKVNYHLKHYSDAGDSPWYCKAYEGGRPDLRRGFGALTDAITGRCTVTLCGDGHKPKGTYCGVGSCNIFGCNCDGGCIPGNAVEEFKKRYGNDVRFIHQYKLDEIEDEILNG